MFENVRFLPLLGIEQKQFANANTAKANGSNRQMRLINSDCWGGIPCEHYSCCTPKPILNQYQFLRGSAEMLCRTTTYYLILRFSSRTLVFAAASLF